MWTLPLALASVTWVLPYLVKDLILGGQGFVKSKNHKKMWMAAHFASIMTLSESHIAKLRLGLVGL